MAPPPQAPAIHPGEVYGRLTVIEYSHSASGKRRYRCCCECGREKTASSWALRSGQTQSCGCLHRERVAAVGRANRRHGHRSNGRPTSTYRSWESMWARCSNPNHEHYADYGGRGITVCERWRDFEAFLGDMGERPEGRTLDRVDNGGSYCKANCRWATRKEQANNRRPPR